jgi:hypothetical protein
MTEKPFKKRFGIPERVLTKKKLTGGRSSGRLLLRASGRLSRKNRMQDTGAKLR